METRRLLSIMIVAAFLMLLPWPALAYDDSLGAHSKINELAIQKFETEVMPIDQYLKYSSLDGSSYGIAWDPEDGTKITPPAIENTREKSMKKWIIDGGFSADEPEGIMALVHFYDPTAPEGKRYLTDQQFGVKVTSALNSQLSNPEIDAVQWGFQKDKGSYGQYFNQLYSWPLGKEYMRVALADTEWGNAGYGKAWRSLGETMHLVADMTVPAHVRNDGHAVQFGDADPYESSTTANEVEQNADKAPMSGINYDQSPEQLMVSVATATNGNFLSKDTIPLPAGVNNSWHKYAMPSINGITPDSKGYLHSTINGQDVRIAAPRTWYSKWFETGQQLYMVDNKVCNDERSVLIPTAIKADEMLVSKFLPRFQVTAQVKPASNGQYTIVGSIKGIQSSEWPDAGSLKVRNGASIVITGSDGKQKSRIKVPLLDKSSDLNSFSFDFDASPGDTVRLEYNLGGYIIRSSDITMVKNDQKSQARTPMRNYSDVKLPEPPYPPLKTYTAKYDNGNIKITYTYYDDPRYASSERHWGPEKEYYENGRLEHETTIKGVDAQFNDIYVGYFKTYTEDGKPEQVYYNDENGVRVFWDQYEGGVLREAQDYWSNGGLKFEYRYDANGKLTYYQEVDSNGKLVLEEIYKDGKLETTNRG